MSHAEAAAEMGRKFRLRPRAAWRVAWGWTLEEAAERFNALRGQAAGNRGGFACQAVSVTTVWRTPAY